MILTNDSMISGYVFTDLYTITKKIKKDYNIFDYESFLLSISNIETFLSHSINDDASIAILRGDDTCRFFRFLRLYDSDINKFGNYYSMGFSTGLPFIFSGDELDIHMFILSDQAKSLFEDYSSEIYDKYTISRIE